LGYNEYWDKQSYKELDLTLSDNDHD
jgi:hypothetical protein